MATCIRGLKRSFLVYGAAMMISVLCSLPAFAQQQPGASAPDASGNNALEHLKEQLRQNRTMSANQAPAQPPRSANPGAAPAVLKQKAPDASGSGRWNGKSVTLAFDNIDMYEFANQMAATLKLMPLVIDSDVKGNVSLISADPISLDEVFSIFNLILKSKGAALIKQGGFYQIVPIPLAIKSGLEIIEHLPAPSPGASEEEKSIEKPDSARKIIATVKPKAETDAQEPRMATHVIRTEFVPVKDLIEPLKLFMTDGAYILAYERLNMLILTDYTDSIAKILELVRMLDNSYLDPDLVELVKIENNLSAGVAEDLMKIFGSSSAKDASTGISFLSLDRLNSIFIMASSKRGLEEGKRWIKELDASGKKFQTFIYVVQNSTASQIATMVTALFGGEGGATGSAAGTAANTSGGTGVSGNRTLPGGINQGFGSASSNFGQSGFSNTNRNQSSMFGNQGFNSGYNQETSNAFGSSQRLGPQLNIAPTITSQILQGGPFSGLQDIVRLVVDDVNNSLIIQSTPADYKYIADTIKKIDVLPRQARIDAQIYQVDLTDNFTFGISGELQKRTENNLTLGKLADTTGKLTAGTFNYIGNGRQVVTALEALKKKTKVKILESPSILALDGKPASFMVGSEIPYPSGSTATTNISTTSIQYRPTGISLMVVPKISASGSVTLDITQEISSSGGNVTVGTESTAPTFKTTSVVTSLSVKDGETIAIAGLIRDSDENSRGGVPILSEIPLLGGLFGTTTRNGTRNELIILITPHVIQTVEKMQEMTQQLRDSLKNAGKFAEDMESEQIKNIKNSREDRYREERIDVRKIKAPKKKKATEEAEKTE